MKQNIFKSLAALLLAISLTACTAAAPGSTTSGTTVTPTSQAVETTSEESASQTDSTQMPADLTTDIVVVGAGGAGLSAAIAATDAGADVILIEKLSLIGGTTIMASTAYNAGGSSVQMAMDDPYTADNYYEKLTKGVGYEDARNRNLADLSGPTCDWLIGLGADLSKVQNGSQHTTADGSAFGPALVGALTKAITERGITPLTETKATSIVIDENGNAAGVTVETKDGNYTIYAKAVILATGGFASNPDMVAEYTPDWAGYPSTASVGATGDGILMAQAVGASIDLMDLAGPQTVAYDTGNGAVSLTNVRYNGAIIVNEEGERFVNELGLTSVIGQETKKQTGGHAFLIFDQVSVDRAALMQTYKDRGYFTEADTLEELAEKLKIDAAQLTSTVETYQGYYDAGEDKDFGRTDSMFSRIDTAPYYGTLISPASQTTYGGILIDLATHVLREDGSAINGLYAAGETTAQYGQGTTIAVVLGKLAGETAAADITK